jgi:hypothetical protein
MFRARSLAASTIAWTIGAASSVGIGLIALTMIGTSFGSGPLQPLSPNAVDPPAATGAPDPSASGAGDGPSVSGSAPSVTIHTVSTTGGNAFVQCVQSGGAYLYGWAPAPGYRVDDMRRGPGSVVTITFKSDQHEVSVIAHCTGDTVEPTVRNDDRGHGHDT